MNNNPQHRVFILMGVSGSGKSAVANAVARDIDTAMLDGDYLHPRANINKMATGRALSDDDRATWLTALNDAIFAMQRTNDVSLLVCSALKKRYRDRLREGNSNLHFIYLRGEKAVIEERLRQRKGHFFKPQLLVSQFEALEEPGADERDVHAIDIHQPLEGVVANAITYIHTCVASR